MPTFESKPLRKSNTLLAKLAPQVRRRPLLFFGLPFLATIVGASFGLANLTQTRYDYNATKVQTISKEEELRMKKDRKRIDIREEYFKLQSKEDELDDWEPKRIERPEGVAEWGVAPTKYRSIQTEGLSSQDAELEKSKGFTADNVRSSRQQPAVLLGPDGKPCRACNSKLAFAAAIKGAKGSAPKDATTGTKKASAAGAAAAATTAAALSSTSETTTACPPDGEELGRSAWVFLHSAAAYFPEDPTAQQQSSMLALFRALPHVYPCHSCAKALGEEYRRQDKEGGWEDRSLRLAEAVRSGPSLRKWLCGIHNEVNQRLGKPRFPCTETKLSERWLEGPADGSCN
ncbi:related to ERV1-mitochondrial biogenesis and regulation of cell cycle [Sporisorium scitamineum]|uniref:Sulfhydryl oxidase n=1 Tax=Sporisorium scitamineum TaxID=49012 RepID=A0A127ZAG8_9BASI|nr:related to ERV1-mitochondrial biogenesis and regulation of cell cycle [Sporisorium scitamineum]